MFRALMVGALAVSGLALVVVTSPEAQAPTPIPSVWLQGSTPGTTQTGNANVSGTLKAGQFAGGGAGITGVNADMLDGLDSTAFLQAIPSPLEVFGPQPASHVIMGNNSSGTNGSSSVRGWSNSLAGVVYGVYGSTESFDGRAVFGSANSATGITFGGYFQSASSSARAVFGYATSTTGASYGIAGRNDSTSGTAVHGFANAATGTTYAGFFQTQSSSGIGVKGLATNTSGTTYGGYFQSDGLSGRGVYGLATSTGITYGGYFETSSSLGRGVFGVNTASTGTNYGVRGQATSINGIGVSGVADAAGATDTPYGVRGEASTVTNGYAVYALGDLGGTGIKGFRIDHPLDPTNKYLVHYASESPFPQNFYNGNVVTDAKGYAWVDLPRYFAEVNTNFKYQLTVVDDSGSTTFEQAKIGRKIANNRFLIMTSAPNVEVSWRVEADRNDLRIKFNRPTDERDKTGAEKGTYQHPEYYNMPPEMGLGYSPENYTKSGR